MTDAELIYNVSSMYSVGVGFFVGSGVDVGVGSGQLFLVSGVAVEQITQTPAPSFVLPIDVLNPKIPS